MKVYILLLCIILLKQCTSFDEGLIPEELVNSHWLLYDFGDCQDLYHFEDSTFSFHSCELMETFTGNYWICKDTLFLLTPKPQKKEVLIGGDSVKVYERRLHSIRPTLEKMYFRNDTLYYVEIFNNYLQDNQKQRTDFELKYITLLNQKK